ncbi:hypothetical protein Q757_08890 [Oenococcus alcoholitolerans]|uniref:Uncharacterized protein n=1 Tax=Oenococcus alcoholitolerans TaxID=931074 RepID=A0ABR4XQ54_9LACO|nr:hypothetical protein Q757_08890 [Oenococcus alcoholitolerans]
MKNGFTVDDLENRIQEKRGELKNAAAMTTGAKSLGMAEIATALN